MLLTITTTYQPATDLGFLLHKHPDRLQSVELSMGKAHIFYPDCTNEKTTIALLLEIDSIEMIRGSRHDSNKNFALGQYVNDRPYVASSFMSVALSKAFSTAMNGTCSTKPELVDVKIPFAVKIAVLPAPKGGEMLVRKLFEPLGYEVELSRHILDERFQDWGESKYFTLELYHNITTKELLSHLYVLIPVLDDRKHYFVNQHEIEKLLAKGKGWLEIHPEKEQIARRYLKNLGSLTRQAIERLNEGEESIKETEIELNPVEQKQKETLNQQRLNSVLEQLKESQAQTVLDLGCGEGKLLRMLLKEKQFSKVVGLDVSYQSLLRAKEKLYWEKMSDRQKQKIELWQGSLTYQDKRLAGFDAAAIVEVIEHLEENRLRSLERVVFEFARPKTVIITTPNAEYNVLFENMKMGSMRHSDHRFEWMRNEFENWAKSICDRYHYQVEFLPIGQEVENIGAPSQMGIFSNGN